MSSPFYRTREWRRLRAQVLARDPGCTTRGCNAASVVADHIVPRAKGGADALHNLRGLCIVCHNQRSQGGEPRAWAGSDGTPGAPGHWWNAQTNLSGLGAGTAWGGDFPVSSDPALFRRRR